MPTVSMDESLNTGSAIRVQVPAKRVVRSWFPAHNNYRVAVTDIAPPFDVRKVRQKCGGSQVFGTSYSAPGTGNLLTDISPAGFATASSVTRGNKRLTLSEGTSENGIAPLPPPPLFFYFFFYYL